MWSPIGVCPTSPFSRRASPRSRPWPTTTSFGFRSLSAERAGNQEFLVPFGAFDRAVDKTQHAPTRLRGEPIGDRSAHLGMQIRIAHDAALAHAALADLELRLDQRHQMR